MDSFYKTDRGFLYIYYDVQEPYMILTVDITLFYAVLVHYALKDIEKSCSLFTLACYRRLTLSL